MRESDNQSILRQRAERLARELDSTVVAGGQVDVTVFLLGSERYALENQYIKEIVPLKSPTELPCTPPFIAGVMSLRGRILSLLDLRILFALPDPGTVEDAEVMVMASEEMEFGLLVNAIEGVQTISLTAMQPDLAISQKAVIKYLRGITADQLILLDGLKLLCDPALVVNEGTN